MILEEVHAWLELAINRLLEFDIEAKKSFQPLANKTINFKIDFCADAFSDPVTLHYLDRFWPI